MANFFSDNKDLQFHLGHPMMRRIVELKERGFAEKDLYDYEISRRRISKTPWTPTAACWRSPERCAAT